MANFAPFEVSVRVTPQRGQGHRRELSLELSRLATLLYEELNEADGVVLANPGGGTERLNSHLVGSNLAAGFSVKPAMGATPAQLVIAGFYEVDGAEQPVADRLLVSAGEQFEGPNGDFGWLPEGQPSATVNAEVTSLKAIIDDAIGAALPAASLASLLRLVYKGVTFGVRGYHFPR